MALPPIVKRTEIEHYMDLGTPESYTLTTSQPENWSAGFTDYFTIVNGVYTAVTGDSAPTWAENTYYSHTSAVTNWVRMGDGWTKFDDGTSAQTESTKYINMDTSSTDTTSYNVSYSFELDLMYADPTIKRVYEIYKNRKVLGECEVDILTVEKFNGSTAEGYVARRETVAIAPSGTSENNNKMKMSGNLNGKGDPVIGKFNNGTFTPDSAA